MNNRRSQYAKMKNLEQVRAERLRIEPEVKRAEERVVRSYNHLRDAFTIPYIVSSAIERVTSVVTAVRTAKSSYDTVLALLGSGKRKRRKERERDEEED